MSALLRLLRFPLLPTALADSAAGYLLNLPDGAPPSWTVLLWLAAASGSLYMGGMVLNDLMDLERDRTLHPSRPLPKGTFSPAGAAALFAVLFSVGGVAGGLATGRSGWAAAALIAAIVLYDTWLKRWRIPGSLAMGACRGLNLFLGAAAAQGAPTSETTYWLPPLVLGAYIASVTWLSTMEETRPEATRWVARLLRGIIPLDAAMLLVTGRWLAALAVLALLPVSLGLRRRLPSHE